MAFERMSGRKLREAREVLGWSWPRLADALGVRADTVKKWASEADPIPYNVPNELRAIAQTQIEALTSLSDTLSRLAVTTQVTTWYPIAGENLEDTANLDPHGQLDLTDEERRELLMETRSILIDRINVILRPYGAWIISAFDGQIQAPVGVFPTSDTPEWEDLREALTSIDLTDCLDMWIEKSNQNEGKAS